MTAPKNITIEEAYEYLNSEEMLNKQRENAEQMNCPGIIDRINTSIAEKQELFDAIRNDETKSDEEKRHDGGVLSSLIALEEFDKAGMVQEIEKDLIMKQNMLDEIPSEQREVSEKILNCSAEALALYKGGKRA